MICLLLLCLAIRLWIIFPYTAIASKSVKSAKYQENGVSVKIMAANVLMPNKNFEALIRIIKEENPDLIFLLETNTLWKENIDKAISAEYPYSVLHPLENTYGLLLYSRLKLRDTKIHFRIENDVPSIESIIELGNDRSIKFFGLHPKPPSPSENKSSLERDAELIQVGKEVRNSECPVLVAGDLNDVAWSHTTRLFLRLSGLKDPRKGRGFFNTFNANYPLIRWPLDHFFLSSEFQITQLKRLKHFGSDHFPILAEIYLPDFSEGSKKSITSKKLDSDDQAEAKDKLRRAIDQ